MDHARRGVSPLNEAAGGAVDLHLHSTASDGGLPPEDVVARAAGAGLTAVALTDHDTVAGVPAARAAGDRLGVRVVAGCEFSVAAPWGEMHLLGYFLPPDSAPLGAFLEQCRADRIRRARVMVDRLGSLGVGVSFDRVLAAARGGALGRPHVARAVVEAGGARDQNEAFDRYLGRGRPAYEPKTLPALERVAALVHGLGGVVSAAHLKDRGTGPALGRLQREGLDAVEVRHPSHSPEQRNRLEAAALRLGLGRSGGSDWHGEGMMDGEHSAPGSQQVPAAWLDDLERRSEAWRQAGETGGS